MLLLLPLRWLPIVPMPLAGLDVVEETSEFDRLMRRRVPTETEPFVVEQNSIQRQMPFGLPRDGISRVKYIS